MILLAGAVVAQLADLVTYLAALTVHDASGEANPLVADMSGPLEVALFKVIGVLAAIGIAVVLGMWWTPEKRDLSGVGLRVMRLVGAIGVIVNVLALVA